MSEIMKSAANIRSTDLKRIHIDNQIYTCAPRGNGRLGIEMETYALLDRLGMAYQRLDHDATATVDDCVDVERILGIEICKNLFLCNSAESAFYLLMMPGGKKYRAPLLSRQLATTRLSFASAASMERLLRVSPGAVSVLGLMHDTDHAVRLLIDKDVLHHTHVGCHPCVNTASLKVSLDELLSKFLPHTGHEPIFVEL